MSGYTRQQAYVDGDVILAEHTNDEFDLLEEVFSTSLGHKHDGTTAEGPTIDLLSDDDGDTHVKVELTADEDAIHFTTAGTEQLTIDSVDGITMDGDVEMNGSVTITTSVDINGGTIDGTTVGATTPATGDFTDVTADSVQVNGGTGSAGTIAWNNTDGTLDVDLLNSVVLQVGQESHLYARNSSGSTITNGSAVRVTGSSGNRATIDLATNATTVGSDSTIAIATQDITNNSNGYVTTFGLVRDIDTSGLIEGDTVYLGVDGALTTTQPTVPAHIVKLGWCIVSHAVNGSIFVNIDHVDDIDHLADVNITSAADNDFLSYNSSTQHWENTKEANFTSGAIDGTTIGGTTPAAGTFSSLVATTADIDAGTIDNTTVGGTTPAPGTFSTLTTSSADINGGAIDGTTVGFTTPSTGDFTALTVSGTDVLVDTDIGTTVQGYDAATAKYDDVTANFTGTLQNGGSNVVVDTDIGSTVQAYDVDTAKYDDATANFTGTLQNGGSNVVVDTDIGSTVQAYDVDTAKLDVVQSWTAAQRGATSTTSATGATTLNFDTYQNFVLTLTGNVTLSNPTTEVVGQSGFIVFIQDGTGSRTVSLGTEYLTAAAAGITLSTAASSIDIVPYVVKATGEILLGDATLGYA